MSEETPIGPLPDRWRLLPLKELTLKIGSGATPRGGAANYLQERTNYALIRSQSVHDRFLDVSSLSFITDEQAKPLRGVEVEVDDLLINITGDGVTFGRCCKVDPASLPAVVNQHVAILRPRADCLISGYLMSYLVHPDIKEYIEGFNAGGSRRAITKSHIENFQIAVPPLPEQRAIAAILGALDDKIEVNRKASATLEAMARALYRSWFVDFDPVWAKLENRPPAHMPPQTAALFPDSFDDEGLPVGWRIQSLSELMDIKGGTQPPKSEFKYCYEPGYVRLVQIRDYETEQHPTFVKEKVGLRRCEGLDIMIGRYGASVGRICWGMDGVYNVALVKAEPSHLSDREFIRSVCLSFEFQEYIQAISGRSAQAGFNKSDIAAFDLVTANNLIREAFSKSVTPLRESQMALRKQNQTLATLRDSLLPRLMSGELRVGDARVQMEEVV